MYCERIRRKFWPEWFVDLDDFYYDGSFDDSTDSSSHLLDLGLYSRTDTFQESNTHTHTHSHPHTNSVDSNLPTPDSDRTGQSLFDSDMDTEASEMDQLKG